MDITTATIIALVLALISIIITAFSVTEGKPSLGRAYQVVGGAVKYWAMIALNATIHTAVFHYSPVWLTVTLVALGLTGLGVNLYWANQVRKSQRKVAEIFEQAAARRAKLAEARSALDAGMVERAERLANEAR